MLIGIYQRTPQHTELAACFIELFQKIYPNAKFVVFYDDLDHYACFLHYYKKLFDFEVVESRAFFDYKPDYVVFTTLHNITTKILDHVFPIKDRCLLVNHNMKQYTNFIKGFPALKQFTIIKPTPLMPIDSHYILPLYTVDNEIRDRNRITILGNMNPANRDIDRLIFLLEQFDFEITIICHSDFLYDTREKLYNYKVDFKIDVGAYEFMDILKSSKFVLGLNKGIYHTEKLTGAIPMALSNNIPLFLDYFLTQTYGLEDAFSTVKVIAKKKEIQEKNLEKLKEILHEI